VFNCNVQQSFGFGIKKIYKLVQSVLQINKETGFVRGYPLRGKCHEQKITVAKTNRKLVMRSEMQGKWALFSGKVGNHTTALLSYLI